MKYEKEFRIKEKEFNPRHKFKHGEVINELANIVKRADLEIEENYKDLETTYRIYDNHVKQLEAREMVMALALGLSLSANLAFILF